MIMKAAGLFLNVKELTFEKVWVGLSQSEGVESASQPEPCSAILQWNARSLISNGYEFKGFIERMHVKPDVICIQETWLKGFFDFVIK